MNTRSWIKYSLIIICIIVFMGVMVGLNQIFSSSRIGLVDLNKIFNDSSFVKEANKKLQANVKNIQVQITAEQKTLKTLVDQYQATKNSLNSAQKKSLETQISNEQINLVKLVQASQLKIKQEQTAGMQQFLYSVQVAAKKVAADKHLDVVFTNSTAIYADKKIDITKEVEQAMQ